MIEQSQISKDWVRVLHSDIESIPISNKISQIDSNQLQFIKMIGSGSFGQVWKGKWRQTQVAIKQVKQDVINEKSKLSELCKNYFLD